MASPSILGDPLRRSSSEGLDIVHSDATQLLSDLYSVDNVSTLDDLDSIDTVPNCNPLPMPTEEIPSLDELLQFEDDPIPLGPVGKNVLETSELVSVELDPRLLSPQPSELQEQPSGANSEIINVVSGSDDPTGSSNSEVQTPPQQLPTVKPRRKRRKDELDYLRVKAKELEDELTQLKTKDAEVDDSEPTLDERGAVSVWRKVARRQLEGKKRAERENNKLRKMVEGKIAIIHNLEKLLRKRSALEEAGALVAERKRVRLVNESERAVFDRLLLQLDHQYTDTDSVFQQNTYASQKVEGEHVQVKPDGNNGMFMEFLCSKVVPFEMNRTATKFWHCMAQPQFKLRDGHYSLADGTEDTLSAKMAFTIQHQKHQVLKDAYFVVKRFIEQHRFVFVWACETTTEGSLSAAQSLRLRDAGWTLVERLPEETESTIVQSCVRVTTQLPDALPHTHEEVMLLTEIVTGSYLENLEGIHQTVEDSLIEEAMQSTA